MTIFKKLINTVKDTTKDIGLPSKRSDKWPNVREEYLKLHPICESCGSSKKLNVHHKKPFHLHPDLELDPTNFITLCMDNDCHIKIGHGDSFKAYNPNVVEDCATVREKLTTEKNIIDEVAIRAKKNRLFE